ncbi:MAG: hypothetical protein K5874_03620 [Bacteroidaceae bacterium]|nr:hypothetical protein [Bacteroidaceae bacterium]
MKRLRIDSNMRLNSDEMNKIIGGTNDDDFFPWNENGCLNTIYPDSSGTDGWGILCIGSKKYTQSELAVDITKDVLGFIPYVGEGLNLFDIFYHLATYLVDHEDQIPPVPSWLSGCHFSEGRGRVVLPDGTEMWVEP